MEETPKEKLARLNKLYVAFHSEEWVQIWKPMLLDHRQEAVEKRASMDEERQDPNLTIIKWIDNFFINIDNLLTEREELESELKDSEEES